MNLNKLLVNAAVVLAGLAICGCVSAEKKIEIVNLSRLDQAELGMSQKQIEDLLGQPNQVFPLKSDSSAVGWIYFKMQSEGGSGTSWVYFNSENRLVGKSYESFGRENLERLSDVKHRYGIVSFKLVPSQAICSNGHSISKPNHVYQDETGKFSVVVDPYTEDVKSLRWETPGWRGVASLEKTVCSHYQHKFAP